MFRRVTWLLLLAIAASHFQLGIAASVGTPQPAPPTIKVIEYYHAEFDHYFITGDATEQQLLDSGSTRGWTRTGASFEAYPPSSLQAGVSPVCRFYGRPDAGLDSHFYSASPNECSEVVRKYASSWQFESHNVFQIPLPDLASGACAAGTIPVYRLFNNRRDANHRYTLDANVRTGMMSAQYISEGYGPNGVVFCAVASNSITPPPSPSAPTVTVATTQMAPDTFAFSSTATPVGTATIASHVWAFGDGTTGTGPAVTHKYATSGTYNVVVTVIDSNNAAATAGTTVTATVAAPTGPPPTVSISVTQVTSDTFSFSSAAAAFAGATIASYAWSFGDGATASGPTATHTYNASGTYQVVLAVTDSRKASASATKSVTAVRTPPPTAPPTIGAPGTWTKYNTSYAAGTEAEYQSWYNLAWDTKRNVAYGLSWMSVLSAFDPTVGTWRRLTPDIGGGVHNRTTAYDPINDRVWIGIGTGSQLLGVNYYDPNTGQWVNHPMTGRQPGSESAMIFDPVGRRFIVFGGWNLLNVHTFSLSPVATSMVDANVAGGPVYATDAQKMTAWRSVHDSKRNRIIYVDTDGSLWVLPMSLSGWQKLATTGTPPPAMTQYVYDAANDALVGWSASPRIAMGDPTPGTTRETWLLPLSTLAWTQAASLSAGVTVPIETVYVGYAMVYDPVRMQTIVHTLAATGNYAPETWAYRYPTTGTPTPPPPPPPPTGTTPTYTGVITSFPLPALIGAPYSTLQSSKHTNMAYSPLTSRLYVQGGDWVHSATDGTWSMSLVDGSWRKDVGDPVYPTLPAPHALQDGAGFAWVASRNKFLIWPGSYFPYEPVGTPIRQYSKGMWWFDPATNTYTQELGLFGTEGESSGSLHGGIYDEINNHIVVLMDSSGGTAARRWDVTSLVRLPDLPYTISAPTGYPAAKGAYFVRGQSVKIGRHVYVVGYATDGTALKIPRFWRWHLDSRTFEELAPPPVDGTLMNGIEVRLGASHGKVVWPFHNGPDGELYGIYVYNPATSVWAVDKQVPAYGNFIGNSVTSLPDGRVALSGGVFGRQQTHMWFFEAKQ